MEVEERRSAGLGFGRRPGCPKAGPSSKPMEEREGRGGFDSRAIQNEARLGGFCVRKPLDGPSGRRALEEQVRNGRQSEFGAFPQQARSFELFCIISSVGRASALQAECRQFESGMVL